MTPLTDEQMREAALIVSVGCDRDTAAKYVGCTAEQLSDHAIREPRFAEDLRRAEAGCEVAHMRNIQQAAKEDRHWRASVWWLERRLPERYGKREADTVSRRELVRFLGSVAGGIAASVRHEEDRRRVLIKLGELADTLVDPLQIEHDADQGSSPGPEHAETEAPRS